jgi:hypothetical protein
VPNSTSYAIDIVIRANRYMHYANGRGNIFIPKNTSKITIRKHQFFYNYYKTETLSFLFNLAVGNSKKHYMHAMLEIVCTHLAYNWKAKVL